jgi:8-oxo-dGTP pyrophosphatase MutT (NUDIX family)
MDLISRQRLLKCIDNTINSGDTVRVPSDYSQASILVIFINDEEEKTSSILITQRKKNLRKHAGQVAFPGGRKEDSDKNLMDTVIRETEEEINLSKDNYEIIGNLPNFYTGTGYVVTPFIALMKSTSNWVNVIYSNPEEVEKIFIPESRLLLSPEFHIREKPPISSSMLMTWRINYNNENIWGLTARVLVTISAGLGLREFPPCDDI